MSGGGEVGSDTNLLTSPNICISSFAAPKLWNFPFYYNVFVPFYAGQIYLNPGMIKLCVLKGTLVLLGHSEADTRKWLLVVLVITLCWLTLLFLKQWQKEKGENRQWRITDPTDSRSKPFGSVTMILGPTGKHPVYLSPSDSPLLYSAPSSWPWWPVLKVSLIQG